MIYFSETPLKMWQPNLIMLDLEDNLGHIYVTRNTYDQAVIISDRFNHDTDLVLQKLGTSNMQEDVTSFMVAVLPSPINILTPFYNLVDKSVKMNVDDLKQVVGVLSYLSTNLDFNMMLKVPFEVRANLVYTKSILLDYQGHFEDFNFKISNDNGHILNEKTGVDYYYNNSSREDREDFELEPKTKIVEEFDPDAFTADIWKDIPIPSMNVTSILNEMKEVVIPVEVNKPTGAKDLEVSEYESIVLKYV